MELWHRASLIAGAFLISWLCVATLFPSSRPSMAVFSHDKGSTIDSWCPFPQTVSPAKSGRDEITSSLPPSKDISGKDWIGRQVERLSAAVNVPTESYDDNGDVEEDPRWRTFPELHTALQSLFPEVHNKAEREFVNRYGLVYTLRGTSDDLKPVMLTAHQDVVPASSPERWMHPPYEAYFDGRHLWGRGASDCKNNLIGVMSTVEFLLEKQWSPKRTIILAFGFDEETGGVRGAAKIAEQLESIWGKGGIELALDEGGMGLTTVGDYVYARPGVAEKGYMDAVLTVDTPGGHSSRPATPHSGIGIMAEIIVALEANPFTPLLTKENPFRGFLECQAKYTPSELEPWLRHALEKDEHDIGRRLADARNGEIRYSMQTSQAVDIIRGGNKVNALPETVTATVNYRIAPHDSLDFVKSHIRRLAEPVVRKHNLEMVDWQGTNTSAPDASRKSSGTLTLASVNDLRPAPISPTDIDNPVWELFSGTIRSVFETVAPLKAKTVVPVGDIMLGNTDTIHYWDLTKNIYRFSPRREGTSFGVHTMDERVEMEAHLEAMRFYYEVILNFDERDV
jgi:Gly-Xaa carboxypeptidase